MTYANYDEKSSLPIITPINSPLWSNTAGLSSTGTYTFNGNNYLSIIPK